MSSFMAFLGNSSFIYIEHYGLTPTQYSLTFSVNAVSFFAVSQATGFLVGRFGLNRVVRIAVSGYAAAMLVLLGLYLAGFDSIWTMGIMMFIAFGFEAAGIWALSQFGRDPVLLLNQLGKRVRMLHLKDRKADVPTSQVLDSSAEHFTEAGNGTIAWRPLLTLAQKQGIEYYFVEQDESDKSPMESLKISYTFLRKIMS